ncbi:hypothetical protein DEI99_006300 [Curtobacterium sp. MCLR17_036]|uniref:hypothetical protein n=1 Tax=Curtobacterium sp. MCLR17_036 TaxID=2175620 RepID=UPI0011B7C1BD|nr:hypothetical protein [Curtobacterium sp. MCLR17_036]WIE66142.1 hypothetical protein DEI99_006300 [Curtobacterium sp. MCLR17_036]
MTSSIHRPLPTTTNFGQNMRLRLIPPIVLVALLTGCSASGNDRPADGEPAAPTASPEVVIGKAKADTQRTEREIAEAVPDRSRVRQQEKGALFPCGEHERQWAGGTNVDTSEEPDMDAVVAAVGQTWGNRSGWKVVERRDSDGLPTIDISTDDGEGYLVSRGTNARTVHIRSSSSCFAVPEVFSGGGLW